ncbi:MAG: hypothetical protein ACRDTM_00440 [Micromonosporaceae bacterium]
MAPPAWAAGDAAFYDTLDLTRPELAVVRAEVDGGDYQGADCRFDSENSEHR